MYKNLILVICKALDIREEEKFELFANPQGFNDTPLLCKRINNRILLWNSDTDKWVEYHGPFTDALTGKDILNKLNKRRINDGQY